MQRQQQQKEAKRYSEIKANLASTFKANYEATKNNYSEYFWSVTQDSNKYVRSSSNYNVYKQDKQLIIGIWNEKKQIIEFVDDIDNHNQELHNLLNKYNVRIE
jgi:hypothetical protein